jgi:hypothetical protein
MIVHAVIPWVIVASCWAAYVTAENLHERSTDSATQFGHSLFAQMFGLPQDLIRAHQSPPYLRATQSSPPGWVYGYGYNSSVCSGEQLVVLGIITNTCLYSPRVNCSYINTCNESKFIHIIFTLIYFIDLYNDCIYS